MAATRSDSGSPLKASQVDPEIQERITQWCGAVRAKESWTVKILDDSRGLANKWAIEASLLKATDDPENESIPVVLAIKDLKAEARRTLMLDQRVNFRSRNLPRRAVPYEVIDRDVRNALKYVRSSKYAIIPPRLKGQVGVYTSDGVIPPSLHRELVKELDALAALEPKDFHPSTNGKVQDLIHPSLYPYVAGVSKVTNNSKIPPLQNGQFKTKISSARTYVYQSRYAWIPSIFRISEDGTDVRINSYINGLGPRERFPELYKLIERVFLFALPHFELTLDFEYETCESSSVQRWYERSQHHGGVSRSEWDALLRRQQEEKRQEGLAEEEFHRKEFEKMKDEKCDISQFFGLQDSTTASDWKGRSLKVIVKAANYILTPGQVYEGTWHMEGMPHERIVASVIYYYDTDPGISDEGLGLRRLRDLWCDFPSNEEYTHDSFSAHIYEEDDDSDEDSDIDPETDYPSDWEDQSQLSDYEPTANIPMSSSSLRMYMPLGTVQTTNIDNEGLGGYGTGRMLSFPNWIQHKVKKVKHSSSDPAAGPVTRKILCFFLVNDDHLTEDEAVYPAFSYQGLKDMNVLTTVDVPNQERCTNTRTLQFLLPYVCEKVVGKCLPPELTTYIISLADLGMTREEAERHRRNLMEDRKIKETGPYPFWSNTYSLCEH